LSARPILTVKIFDKIDFFVNFSDFDRERT
jgi:hypothetical protein